MKKRSIKLLAILMAVICAFCAINVTAYADELKTDTVSVSYSNKLSKPKVKISVTNTKEPELKISWDKVEGATKYYIYRTDTKGSNLKLIAKTSKLYYKDTNVSKNKTYYYKVRAYQIKNKKIVKKSDSSSTVSKAIVSLSKVKNVKATAVSESKIKLSWDKVSGATRYYLYYSTSKNGTYKSIGYVTKNTYTFTKLNSSTTYYFKVKSAKKLDSKVYKASYSPVASAKTNSKDGEFIVDFKKISNKEAGLPTGSAITCLAILMNHYGVDVTPKELVPYFNCSTDFYYKNGVLWGPDMDYEFAGDPTSDKAYAFGCNLTVINIAYKNYLKTNDITTLNKASNNFSIFESEFENNKKFLNDGNIVLACMKTSKNGKCFEWQATNTDITILDTSQEYVIICGYSDDSYIVYNPLSNKYEKYRQGNKELGFITLVFPIKNK